MREDAEKGAKATSLGDSEIDPAEKLWRISSLTASVDDETKILVVPLPESKRKVKVADNTGEQIAWFRMRVVPQRIVAVLANLAGLDKIAVGQKLRELPTGLDPHREDRHHVGAVREKPIRRNPSGSHCVQYMPPDR